MSEFLRWANRHWQLICCFCMMNLRVTTSAVRWTYRSRWSDWGNCTTSWRSWEPAAAFSICLMSASSSSLSQWFVSLIILQISIKHSDVFKCLIIVIGFFSLFKIIGHVCSTTKQHLMTKSMCFRCKSNLLWSATFIRRK